MNNSILCSVVIPAFNEEDNIGRVISALHNQSISRKNLEIIVVDNGSIDSTASIAKTLGATVIFFPEGNVGAVRNKGAKHAQSNIVAFLDADCLPSDTWIETGLNLIQSSPNIVFGGPCKAHDKTNWIERYWLLETEDSHSMPKALLGASIFIRKEIIELVGGFNEVMTSGEDSDITNKIKNLPNHSVSINPDLMVVHLGNATTIKGFIKRQIWHSENYFLFLKESLRDKTFWITMLFSMLLAGLPFSFISGNQVLFTNILILSLLPLALTTKRLCRANYFPETLLIFLKIWTLDFFYLAGRTIGLIKSIFKRIR